MAAYFLGVDVGTSGTKAVLIRDNGSIMGSASESYPLYTPRPLWSEQDPHDWWQATCAAIRRLLIETGISAHRIETVGLTGQMHGLVLLDGAGEVIRPAILWNDQRTAAQCRKMTETIGAKEVIERLGNPILAGFTAPKIVWVRDEEPKAYARAAKVLLPKDYVRYRLTGAFAMDVSDASGTALFNVGRREWDTDTLSDLEIPPEWMPDVFESPERCAEISAEGAAASSLIEGTPVVAGAGDQAAGAVGAGIVREGVISVTLGTSGVVFAASDAYRVEPSGKLHAFCHAVPNGWHLMGVMLSAAGSFEWFASTFGDNDYDALNAAAAEAPAGSEGLTFLPYLSGERTPHADPNARGVFFGITLRHGKGHFARAVMEGVAYGLKDSLELMHGLGISASDLRVSGGGARSGLWLQILADVFGEPVRAVNPGEGAAYGAALLAAVGGGAFASVKDAGNVVKAEGEMIEPGPASEEYAKAYERFGRLYPALKEHFEGIG
ncbi:MAG TPA: xylulokinase [Rhodothermales bacterium]|nr:xylulokinase [Rhodothermales bacterium]